MADKQLDLGEVTDRVKWIDEKQTKKIRSSEKTKDEETKERRGSDLSVDSDARWDSLMATIIDSQV